MGLLVALRAPPYRQRPWRRQDVRHQTKTALVHTLQRTELWGIPTLPSDQPVSAPSCWGAAGCQGTAVPKGISNGEREWRREALSPRLSRQAAFRARYPADRTIPAPLIHTGLKVVLLVSVALIWPHIMPEMRHTRRGGQIQRPR